MPPAPAETKTAETMLDLIQSSGFGAEFRLYRSGRDAQVIQMSRLINITVALLMAVAVTDVRAQSTGPAFEVESVKAMPQDGRTWALRQVDPARYRSLSNVRQLL